MLPKLYSSFNNGAAAGFLGTLDRCTKCLVAEVRNGSFTLELETTENDACAGVLSSQKIIVVKPNPFDSPQSFEISSTKRVRGSADNLIRVNAKHVKDFCFQYFTTGDYDNEGVIITRTGTPSQLWQLLTSDYISENVPFSFHSNISTEAEFSLGLSVPESLGNILGGKSGSFLDLWHGELRFDNGNIYFNTVRGRDIGFQLRYGANISDMTQSEDSESVYSHIFPYGRVLLTNSTGSKKINFFAPAIEIPNHQSCRRRVFALDCTDFLDGYSVGEGGARYDEVRAAMSAYARQYAVYNELGKVKVSIDVTLRSELDKMKLVGLCDTVTVVLDKFGTKTTAKIVEAVYDSLLERWERLSIGSQRVSVADLFIHKERYIK